MAMKNTQPILYMYLTYIVYISVYTHNYNLTFISTYTYHMLDILNVIYIMHIFIYTFLCTYV